MGFIQPGEFHQKNPIRKFADQLKADFEGQSGFAHPAISLGFEKMIPAAKATGIGALSVREGYQPLVTDITASAVETVCEYHAGATRKLLAASGGGLYDATGTPNLLASGFTGNRWQSAGFNGRLGVLALRVLSNKY